MKNVTLRQLRIFSTVARQLSFTRAARCLYTTQPAVSTQMHQLEEALASPLFDRVGRSISLTEAGRRLLTCADEIEQLLQKTEESLAALKGLKTGTLKVGAVDTANYFAASLVNAFSADHPSVTVRYTVDKTREIVSLLVEGQTEVIIVSLAPTNLDIVSEPFATHPYVIVAPPGHPLAKVPRVTLKRLFRERFISREPGGTARTIMDHLAEEAGMPYMIELETNSNETIKQAVMAGLGIGCISGHTLTLELLTKRLVALKVERFPVIKNWHLIHLRERQLSPVALAFRDYLMEHGAQIIERVMGTGNSATQSRGRKPTDQSS